MDAFSPQGALVYVVDDDPAVRTALEFALELEGFRVEALPSGEALLRAVLPSRGACIVLDEKLPGASGLETLRILRARGVELPAIFITTAPNPHFRNQVAAEGARIIEKPLFGDDLIVSIRQVLSRL